MASTSMDPPPEYTHKIYLVTNKENGKQYVGQAAKTVGLVKNKWGTAGRWKCHLREAKSSASKGQKSHCVLLDQAILKYGEDNFDVKKLEDVTEENLDDREIHYIEDYNALAPNGYNLDAGGSRGKDSDETREKKRQMRLGKKHKSDTKESISMGQLGNRRGTKARKHPEDASLPKYIMSTRKKDAIIGYKINSFPVGVDKKEYISKSFTKMKDEMIEKTLERAIAHLEELKEKYATLPDEIKKKSIEDNASKPDPVKKPIIRSTRKNKYGVDKYDMPKYVAVRRVKEKETGFEICGLRVIDENGDIKPYRKSWTDPTLTMEQKLDLASKHIEEVKKTHKCVLED